MAKVVQDALYSVLNTDRVQPWLTGTRCKQGSGYIQETGKHISLLLFFPQSRWCRSSKFSLLHPPVGPDNSPVMAISRFRGKHEDLPFDWLQFQ